MLRRRRPSWRLRAMSKRRPNSTTLVRYQMWGGHARGSMLAICAMQGQVPKPCGSREPYPDSCFGVHDFIPWGAGAPDNPIGHYGKLCIRSHSESQRAQVWHHLTVPAYHRPKSREAQAFPEGAARVGVLARRVEAQLAPGVAI